MIQAIPTTHNGVSMRSRLEARFATCLDRLGIKWVYEAEGFDIDGTWYLPDFWLPDFRAFIEVKGVLDESVEKPRKLSLALRGSRRVFIVDSSDVQKWESHRDSRDPGCRDLPAIETLGFSTLDRRVHLFRCDVCRSFSFHGTGGVRLIGNGCCIRVYLAGKVSGSSDWRIRLAPNFRWSFRPDTDWSGLEVHGAIGGRHVITGPFFDASRTREADIDWDGLDRNTHLVDRGSYSDHEGVYAPRADLFESCKSAIERSDAVFAWIEDKSAFGTLFELGYAHGCGKPIFVGGPAVDDDLWFAQQASSANIPSSGDIVESFRRFEEWVRL